jgi:glucose/arabinose dehydrogenase
MRRLAAILLAAAATLATAPAAQAAPTLIPVGSRWDAPIYAASPPRDRSRLFVVQRAGLVRVVVDGAVRTTPFADLTGQVGTDGERGLLSIAFPPDYEASGLAYVYLAAPDGELQIRELHRSAADPDVADPGPGRIMWRQAHDQASNHNGGTLAFGPDGMLWFATGDGGGGNDTFGHAQDLGSQLGKVLRIDPRAAVGYRVPRENPYGNAIWAAGLRNPFRFSFDRGTGDLLIGDVGQGAREEVDWVRFDDVLGRAGNYGWACFEGFAGGPKDCAPEGYIPPIHDYFQDSPRAVTGGVVVRDPGLPTLTGRYVYADSFNPDIRSLVLGRPATGDASTGLSRSNTVAFGEDACGHVYVVSIDPGSVERIQDGAAGACVLTPEPRPLPGQAPTGGSQGPAPPGATPDTRGPRLQLRVTGRRSLAVRRRLRVRVRSDEAAAVRIGGRLRGVAGVRAARRGLAAGRRVVVSVRITKRTARRLRRTLRRKRVIAALSIVARDAAGNPSRAARRIKVPRRR